MLKWAALWLGTAALLLFRHWRSGKGVGILFTYMLSFGMLHWVAPALYLLPWYDTPQRELTAEGLKQSAVAMLALAAGVEVAFWKAGRWIGPITSAPKFAVDPRFGRLYLIAGGVVYGVVAPFARSLPSIGAVVSTGSTLIVVGLALNCWNAWRERSQRRLWLWLAATCLLPLVTVVFQGFLGYGFAAMLSVFAVVASFYRPRWKLIVVGSALAYVGVSVFVTYMRDRDDIRAVVWSGGTFGDRMERMSTSFSEGEWFDIHNVDQLQRMDLRLNQDYLVGLAAVRLQRGQVDFARGSTLRDAVLAIVPRAVWPDKPMSAGSGNLVPRFTGIAESDETSIGIGQVMECYINFGTPGLLVGFFGIGVLLVLFDQGAVRALQRGDAATFTAWFLPGICLLQIGGSFVEVTSMAGASLVLVYVLSHLTSRLIPRRPARVPLAASVPATSRPR